MIITCVSCDLCRCGGCVQQVTCQWCSRDLECKPREANSCSDGNVVYTVSGLKGEGLRRWGGRGDAEVERWKGRGLRWRGGRGEAEEEWLIFPATSRQKGVSSVFQPYYFLFFLLFPLMSNLSWRMQWLQDATQNRCPQIVPTPGLNLYSFPVHINMTSHIDVHVTFADNTIPVSHTSLSTNCC